MKTVLFLLAITLTLNTVAQKNNAKVVLTKGQKILVKTTSTQEADMGMGMEMKNFSTMENKLVVIAASDASATITNTLTGVKLSMDLMGQSTTYDSDKKEDSASEIGKTMQDLNQPDTFILNKYIATVTANKKEVPVLTEQANPVEGMFQALGNNKDNLVEHAFFLIPKDKKPGDKWEDSTITKDVKSYSNYFLKSIDKGIATIAVDGKVQNNTQTEMQGMQVTVNMAMTSTTEINVDTNTGNVKKRDAKADITGTLEMMGQSLPVTGKGTSLTTYEY
ncbi:hypothetical protein BH11BAC4_BH11BAC4_04130 [soil metagenome]